MELYFFIVIVLIIICILLLKFKKNLKSNLDKKEYMSYVSFLGDLESDDKNYNKKINKIIELINTKNMTDIKEIATLSNCSYHECILKIKFLKQQGLIENYYVDEQNGIINQCSISDRKLLNKYAPFIYTKQLPLDYIAKSLPQCTLENFEDMRKMVLNDLAYLDGKNLLNGINIDLVDEKIIYYKKFKNSKEKDFISIECENCGAPNDVPRGGKARCDYCDTIIEDKVVNN